RRRTQPRRLRLLHGRGRLARCTHGTVAGITRWRGRHARQPADVPNPAAGIVGGGPLMRTLVHLSDLHFGRVDPAVVAVVRDTVRALTPDLVVVSGDFTQR